MFGLIRKSKYDELERELKLIKSLRLQFLEAASLYFKKLVDSNQEIKSWKSESEMWREEARRLEEDLDDSESAIQVFRKSAKYWESEAKKAKKAKKLARRRWIKLEAAREQVDSWKSESNMWREEARLAHDNTDLYRESRDYWGAQYDLQSNYVKELEQKLNSAFQLLSARAKAKFNKIWEGE